jgi:general secretion pathway protein D
VQLQVLIDVQILSVTMSDKKSTGINWAQLYALQNIELSADVLYAQNVSTFTGAAITTGTYPSAAGNQATVSSLFKASGTASLNEVIKFLKTQGDVNAVSNPKVLTLNNQPALITVGTEHFYKITSSETLAGGTTATATENDEVKSVFAGVLLDITPEISDDRTITLKINPSLSETTTDISTEDNTNRQMPPDLNRRQLSSVVTVKDGNRIILGGLINSKNTMDENKVPLLGDIPLLGYMFKYEEKAKSTQELVIIIEPHIIDKENSKLSLKDLGYRGLDHSVLSSNESNSTKPVTINIK